MVEPSSGKNIGIFTLTLLNVAAVLSVVNYPEQAEYGWKIVFFILAGSILFLVPTGLVAAELASAWPREGGLYLWGNEAFGPRWGFIAIMLQFLNALPLFGTILTFVSTTIAYAFDPELAKNPLFVYVCMLVCLWTCTLLNCFGLRLYAFLGSWSAFFGTLVPTFVLILCAGIYFSIGHVSVLSFSPRGLLPDFSDRGEWMFLAGIMVSLAGIDMTALHITEVRKPKLVYHSAMFLSLILIVGASIFGSLAIALTVPPEELSMASGVSEAVEIMFGKLGIRFLMPFFSLFLAVGGLSTVIAWLLGPSKGIVRIAGDGYLPAFWAQCNAHGIPVRILLLQAFLASVIGSAVLILPGIGEAFWYLMVLTAQIYMSMYLLLFACGFYLRIRHPETPRPFRVPGGTLSMFVVCGVGSLSAFAAMVAGYIPPDRISSEGAVASVLYTGSIFLFTAFVIGGLYFMSGRLIKKHAVSNSYKVH